MHQHINGLAELEMKAVIRIVGARRQPGDIERNVGCRQAARLHLVEGCIRGFAGGAPTEQQHGENGNGDSHGRAEYVSAMRAGIYQGERWIRDQTGYPWNLLQHCST